MPLDKNYGFFVSKDGYYPFSDNIDLRKNVSSYNMVKDFQLVKIKDIVQGDASIELNNVFFGYDKYVLKNESFPELNRLADFLKQSSAVKIEISGHTDNKGSISYNKELSEKRAEAVKTYLITCGCSGNQIITVGYGDSKPIADNNTEEGRKRNRRVEFRVVR